MNAKQRQLRLQDYLEHMLEASRLAQQYLAGVDKAEFFASRMIQQAVLMNIVIIGETATQIRDEHPDFVKANVNSSCQRASTDKKQFPHTLGQLRTFAGAFGSTFQRRLRPGNRHLLADYVVASSVNTASHIDRKRSPGYLGRFFQPRGVDYFRSA